MSVRGLSTIKGTHLHGAPDDSPHLRTFSTLHAVSRRYRCMPSHAVPRRCAPQTRLEPLHALRGRYELLEALRGPPVTATGAAREAHCVATPRAGPLR